jgi:CxxC motif-containing protein
MNRSMTCIACPRGCLLDINQEDGEITISGNQCKRGVDYALQELKESLRMLTTTVRTAFPESSRLPVKLSREVPIKFFPEYMKAVNSFVLDHSCIPGDILMQNILESSLGSGVDLLATGALYSKAAKLKTMRSDFIGTGAINNEG